MRSAYAELLDSLCKVVLVIHLRDDDLGSTSKRGKGCGACTAVMDNRRHPFEQRLQIGFADDQAVGFVIHDGQIGPTLRDDYTTSKRAGGLHHHLTAVFRRAVAAEAEEDGRFASVEKRLQLGGEWTCIRQDPGALLKHGLICRIGPRGANTGSAASQG